MSESLPYSGVAIVDVIRYAVVTQACSESPCRSSPMVRIAVATMVWSRAARNMPIISPPRIVRIWRCVMLNVSAAEAGMAGPLVAVGEVGERRRRRQAPAHDGARVAEQGRRGRSGEPQGQ